MNKTAEQFFKKAQAFIAKLPSEERGRLPSLQRDSDELDAWAWYFDNHLGWRPYAFQQFFADRTKGFTVPTQWPEWFDETYAPPPRVPRLSRPSFIPRHLHESRGELEERLGPSFGMGSYPPSDSYPFLAVKYGRPMGPFEAGTKWEQYVGRTTAEKLPQGMAQVGEVVKPRAYEIPISDALKAIVCRQKEPVA
jgi:hypothetical protein